MTVVLAILTVTSMPGLVLLLFGLAVRQMVSDVVDHGGPMIDRRARTFAQLLGLPV